MQTSSDPVRLKFIPGKHTDVIFVETSYRGPLGFLVVLALGVAGMLLYWRRRASRKRSS